jgi:hypothetical protein
MAEFTTRISDLPDNITMQTMHSPAQNPLQSQATQNSRSDESGAPIYLPMNVHPNPYGGSNEPTNSVMPIPRPENVATTYTLPSRDIPRNTDRYTQDEEIQANYIPKPSSRAVETDYIKDFEEKNDKERAMKNALKKGKSKMEMIWNELQIPLFISLLFFVFQLPLLQVLTSKYLGFLAIYDVDGNMNTRGLLTKSALFGLFYYLFIHAMEYLNEV